MALNQIPAGFRVPYTVDYNNVFWDNPVKTTKTLDAAFYRFTLDGITYPDSVAVEDEATQNGGGLLWYSPNRYRVVKEFPSDHVRHSGRCMEVDSPVSHLLNNTRQIVFNEDGTISRRSTAPVYKSYVLGSIGFQCTQPGYYKNSGINLTDGYVTCIENAYCGSYTVIENIDVFKTIVGYRVKNNGVVIAETILPSGVRPSTVPENQVFKKVLEYSQQTQCYCTNNPGEVRTVTTRLYTMLDGYFISQMYLISGLKQVSRVDIEVPLDVGQMLPNFTYEVLINCFELQRVRHIGNIAGNCNQDYETIGFFGVGPPSIKEYWEEAPVAYTSTANHYATNAAILTPEDLWTKGTYTDQWATDQVTTGYVDGYPGRSLLWLPGSFYRALYVVPYDVPVYTSDGQTYLYTLLGGYKPL